MGAEGGQIGAEKLKRQKKNVKRQKKKDDTVVSEQMKTIKKAKVKEKKTIEKAKVKEKQALKIEKAKEKEIMEMLHIVPLDKLRTKIRMGIDNNSDELIGALGTVLNPDCVVVGGGGGGDGVKKLVLCSGSGNDGGGSVDLSEKGLFLIPATERSKSQAKIMYKELEETVKDEAILTGKRYVNQYDLTLTRSYIVFSKNTRLDLKKRKQAFKDLYLTCGKNKHQIVTDSLKCNYYQVSCARDTHND